MLTKSKYRKLAETGKLPGGLPTPDEIHHRYGISFGCWYDAILGAKEESTFENALILFRSYCHQNGGFFIQPSRLLTEHASRNVWIPQNVKDFLGKVNTRTLKVNGFKVI